MDENGVALEMSPIGDPCDADDDEIHLVEPPTQHQLTKNRMKGRLATSRRVRRNYLCMIMLAYILTITSPGTNLWSSSTCNPSLKSNRTNAILPFGLANSPGDVLGKEDYEYHNETSIANSGQVFDECITYDGGSMNFSNLAKLTFFTIVLILMFFDLQGSDPGFLTNDVMSRLDASETTNRAPTIDGSDCDMDADSERQCFLEPPPLLSDKVSLTLPSQPTPQPMMQHLYPHTRRKYCEVCRHSPPLRSHHCNVCDRCVATFDHHCFFLDTCIGERNHFRFWLFVSLNVICFHVALGIVGSDQIASAGGIGLGAFRYARIEIPIGRAILILSKIYMYPLYYIVVLLWMIHTILALGNSTTFELTKGAEHIDYLARTSATDFPFGRGLLNNMQTFILRDEVCSMGRLGLSRKSWRCRCCRASEQNKSDQKANNEWVPILWKMPQSIDEESADWWNHPWKNKYWSCC